MKVNLTEHERDIVICVLREANSMIAIALAEKINNQNPAEDGPEVEILNINREGWDY